MQTQRFAKPVEIPSSSRPSSRRGFGFAVRPAYRRGMLGRRGRRRRYAKRRRGSHDSARSAHCRRQAAAVRRDCAARVSANRSSADSDVDRAAACIADYCAGARLGDACARFNRIAAHGDACAAAG